MAAGWVQSDAITRLELWVQPEALGPELRLLAGVLYICIYLYVCMYVCMYIYIYIYMDRTVRNFWKKDNIYIIL